jgi:hypothetical protein
MRSTTAGERGRTSADLGARTGRTLRAGFVGMRPCSTARCRMLPSSPSDRLTATLPAPDRMRSACHPVMRSTVSPRSGTLPSCGPMWLPYRPAYHSLVFGDRFTAYAGTHVRVTNWSRVSFPASRSARVPRRLRRVMSSSAARASSRRLYVRARFWPSSRHRTRQTVFPSFLVTFSTLTSIFPGGG